MAYTYDEDGLMTQSIIERQRKRALEQMQKEREKHFRQESIKYYNRENQ